MRHGTISSRLARGLLELRSRIERANIPPSILDQSFNLATWNIREFGKKPRMEESLHYIAEILYQFDLIAVTEVRDNLGDLSRVLQILGPYWKVVFSDYISDPGGNRERVAYVYDKRMIAFTGLASESDSPRKKNAETGEYVAAIDWWRAPVMASFKAGNFDFTLLTVHIRWGKNESDRIGPLKSLAEWVHKRRREKHCFDRDIIILGDLNIPDVDDACFKAITSRGLKIPGALRGSHGSNLARDKRYDQILYCPGIDTCFTNRGGVLDFYADDHTTLYPFSTMSKLKFTYQLSDHLPLWVQVNTEVDDVELDQAIRGG